MRFAADVEEFAAERRAVLERGDEALGPVVAEALALFRADPESDWYAGLDQALRTLWDDTFADEFGEPSADEAAQALALREEWVTQVNDSLEQTSSTTQDDRAQQVQEQRITRWLSTYTVNSATTAAAEVFSDGSVQVEWVTMRDDAVRETHRAVEGQQRPVGETFNVGGSDLRYPGEPVGPPSNWIECRCVLRPVPEGEEMSAPTAETFALDDEIEVDEDAPEMNEEDLVPDGVPFHGVLAPIGKMSGDRRRFKEGSITWRDGPAAIPLRFVKADVGGHTGAVRVANFERIWEEDGEVRATGTMFNTPEADEAIGILAEGPMGVSVDLDQMTASYVNEDGSPFDFEVADIDGPEPVMDVEEGRVSAATLVDIPAFQEAYIALGPWPEEEALVASCLPCEEMDRVYNDLIQYAISEADWDGSASRFNDEQWIRSTVVDRGEEFGTPKERYAVPIREPNGDLNRNAVHNAAARINQVDAPDSAIAAGKRALVAAYRQLDEDPPEAIMASAMAEFQDTHDGPGWITNPRETQRLRDYWTRGAGAAKIRWGQPGDFNRCRSQLRKYITNPRYLAGTCANLHKVALGVWPGQEVRTNTPEGAVMASAFNLVTDQAAETLLASAARPSAWFQNPNLDGPTPVTVEDDGRVYGHVATFDICHIANPEGPDKCTLAPRSQTDYAYFKTGIVRTDEGDIPVGHITLGTGHAGGRLSANRAAAHYDNTGAVVADVNVGEDEFGIWFSGALRPDLAEETVDTLRAAALSGDWRTIRGNHELVAALAVNVPGFPIPRVSLAASAEGGSLVAAGVVSLRDPEMATVEPMDPEVFADAVLNAMDRRKRYSSVKEALTPEVSAYEESVKKEREERLAAARALISQ